IFRHNDWRKLTLKTVNAVAYQAMLGFFRGGGAYSSAPVFEYNTATSGVGFNLNGIIETGNVWYVGDFGGGLAETYVDSGIRKNNILFAAAASNSSVAWAISKAEGDQIFQDNLLFPHMTALENIEFAARCRKMSKNHFNLKTELWFRKLDMSPFLHKKCLQLSGGEKQRTALLQAMITSPRLLILDEPFSALNEELRNESREVVKELVSLEKIPVLLVTHDQKDVDMLGTKVTHIQKGKIIADNKL
ncbi:MAG: ATP-binding cassette domain-containing protein, partial [Pseudobdellovibrionaceae bacterium]